MARHDDQLVELDAMIDANQAEQFSIIDMFCSGAVTAQEHDELDAANRAELRSLCERRNALVASE